jgi:hypothetical protein
LPPAEELLERIRGDTLDRFGLHRDDGGSDALDRARDRGPALLLDDSAA